MANKYLLTYLAAFKNKDFNTLMCRGAMPSKKESILRLGKSKKNNATKEHPVSLVFTNVFRIHSAQDTFVINCVHWRGNRSPYFQNEIIQHKLQ